MRPLFQMVADSLPCLVERLNIDEDAQADAAQNELVVQREIVALLRARLPCGSLVRQNRMLIRDTTGVCIPDIVVDQIGGGCWAAIELKVRLAGDSLPRSLVLRDFDKLCRYKAVHPEAHCVFMVIESSKHSFVTAANSKSRGAWIASLFDAFKADSAYAHVKSERERYSAFECARTQREGPMKVTVCEIVENARASAVEDLSYRFTARMSGPSIPGTTRA